MNNKNENYNKNYNKNYILLGVIHQEKYLISSMSSMNKDDRNSANKRLKQIQEIKAKYSQYELDYVIELAKKNRDIEYVNNILKGK